MTPEDHAIRISLYGFSGREYVPPLPVFGMYPAEPEGRQAGTGGGGQSATGGVTPFFCKGCGKSSKKEIKFDVCNRCKRRKNR